MSCRNRDFELVETVDVGRQEMHLFTGDGHDLESLLSSESDDNHSAMSFWVMPDRIRKSGTKEVYRPDFAFKHWLADIIEPKADVMVWDHMKAIARGDIECYKDLTGGENSAQPDTLQASQRYVLGEMNTETIQFETAKMRRTRRRVQRTPILAGDIARRVKLEFPSLVDNSESRLIVSTVVTRQINALVKQNDPTYRSLRSKEMLSIAQWACELFWIETEAEEGIRLMQEATRGVDRSAPIEMEISHTA